MVVGSVALDTMAKLGPSTKMGTRILAPSRILLAVLGTILRGRVGMFVTAPSLFRGLVMTQQENYPGECARVGCGERWYCAVCVYARQ